MAADQEAKSYRESQQDLSLSKQPSAETFTCCYFTFWVILCMCLREWQPSEEENEVQSLEVAAAWAWGRSALEAYLNICQQNKPPYKVL